MALTTYRITLDVYNSVRRAYPVMRVNVLVKGIDPRDARSKVRTVYVSSDLQTVNLSGGLGDGYWYNEWTIVRTRKVPEPKATDSGVCQWFALCQNAATRTIPHPILGAVPACERCAGLASE